MSEDVLDEYVTDDEEAVAEREKQIDLEIKKQDLEFQEVMSTKAGRNVVWQFLCMARLYNTPAGDTNDIMRAIGRQDMGREIQSKVFTLSPEMYMIMVSEGDERDKKIGNS